MKQHYLLSVFFAVCIAGNLIHAQGISWQWVAPITADNANDASDVSSDEAGNVYVSGSFTASTITIGNQTLQNRGNLNGYIAKYDPAGSVVWVRQIGGNTWDNTTSVASDHHGNVYVTGTFASDTMFVGNGLLLGNGTYDIYVAKFDSAGNFQWANAFGGRDLDESTQVAADENAVAIVGHFYSDTIWAGSSVLINDHYWGEDAFVVKISSAGNFLWARSMGGSDYEIANGVTIDSFSVVITGIFHSDTLKVDTARLINAGMTDAFIIRYDNNGNIKWAERLGGTNEESGAAICTANHGICVTGYDLSDTIHFGQFSLFNSTAGGTFTMQLDTLGNPVWISNANMVTFYRMDICSDPEGNVYTYGAVWAGTMDFGQVSVSTANMLAVADVYVIKFDQEGNAIMGMVANGDNYENAMGITVDSSHNVYLAGNSNSSVVYFGNIQLTDPFTSDNGFLAKLSAITAMPEIHLTEAVDAFPNPFTSVLSILVPGTTTARVCIYDTQGRLVFTREMQPGQQTLDAGSLAEGVYTLRIFSDDRVFSQKLVHAR